MKKIAARVRILSCTPAEGQLRRVFGEDGELIVFDTQAVAVLEDGRSFVHATFIVKGAVEGPDGWCPNYNWRNLAEAFCSKVEALGTIDLAHWDEVRESSWAEREAYNLKCEVDERAWGN